MVVVGLDEAGTGPLLGSLWASAVHLPTPIVGLADSKRLSAQRRAALRETIVETAQYGMGEVTSTEIDTIGMGEARRLVFERALEDYVSRGGAPPTHLRVDGTLFRPWSYRGAAIPYALEPGADATVPCVSAASIMAKTTRDAQILALCDAHPDITQRYDLRANKGYPSARHVAALRTHGYTPWHRTSFRVRALRETPLA